MKMQGQKKKENPARYVNVVKEKERSLVSKRAASWGDYTISLPGERKMSLVAKKK